jgi:hypothetical protein
VAEDLPSSTAATTFKLATVLVAAFPTTVSLLLVGAVVPRLLYFLAL